MLPKKNRVDKKSIEEIFIRGKSINSPSFNFKFFKNNSPATRISFIAPKNVAKLAVARNSLRRRGYSALKKFSNQFPTGITGVFIYKRFESDRMVIENEIQGIFSKIN